MTGKISRYVFLAKNEATILTALQRGPITVSIVANPKFILYTRFKYVFVIYLLFLANIKLTLIIQFLNL